MTKMRNRLAHKSFTTLIVRHHIPASSSVSIVILTPPTKYLYLEDNGMWCSTILENGQPAARKNA